MKKRTRKTYLNWTFLIMIVIVGTILSLVAWKLGKNWQNYRYQIELDKALKDYASALETEMVRLETAISSLKSFFLSSEMVTHEEFSIFVQPYLTAFDGIYVIGWIPVIPNSTRKAFERRMRREITDFSIREFNVNGQLVRAKKRDVYFPFTIAEPRNEQYDIHGYDIATQPEILSAIHQATDENMLVASGPIDIIQNEQSKRGIIILLPIYESNPPATNVTSRRNTLQSFVGGIFQIEGLFERIIRNREHQHITVTIQDLAVGGEDDTTRTFLYRHEALCETCAIDSTSSMADRLFTSTQTITVGTRRWSLTAAPSNFFFRQHRLLQAGWLFATGMAFTLLIAIIVMLLIHHNELVERLVEQRTQELADSESRFRSLVETSNDWIWQIDQHAIFTYSSPQGKQVLGYTPQEIIGKTPYWHIHPDDVDRIKVSFNDAAKQYQPLHNLENISLHRDGRRIALETNAAPIISQNGELLGFRGISRDITERKKAEAVIRKLNDELEQRVIKRTAQLEAVNQELKEFAYIISHDLKAPLRAVSQLATWLYDDYTDKFDEQGKLKLELLIGRVRRMGQLINGVLEYSRVGRIDEQQDAIVLTELVKEIVESLAAPERITINVDSTLPVIHGSRIRITQLFQNLISNAIKFMDKPDGRINISSKESDDKWQFAVADNGPGIDKSNYQRIFQIFQTLQSRDDVECTGIGLTLVKKIVEQAGGMVWVESIPGRGSTFYFTWPKVLSTL
ncbi:CHASE domain-containing protein [candidate division KSB1 bacterium]|nr:CHASE domain-containing protein [candidate division KSB1 bacterium]